MSQEISISSAKEQDLLFTSMAADERLGELFDYDVAFESQDTNIDLSGLLSTPMTVKLATRDGYTRYFNGMVSEAEQTGVEKVQNLVYATYRVSLVPKPWLLQGVVDCRIFKDMSSVDIVKAVLQEVGYTDVESSLSGTYPEREYCVQYREDGWNFIQRLLQQEGIYFYFKHSDSTHTMVLADGVGSHSSARKFDKVSLMRTRPNVLHSEPVVTAWKSLRGVDGAKVSLTDYNPLTPKTSLLANETSDGHGASGITVFDYPGTHADAKRGQHFAQVRAEALSASRSRYVAETGACSATLGALFTLRDHPSSTLNQEYLVTAAAMELSAPGYASGAGKDAGAATCSCRFEALESKQPWRNLPAARKPTVVGLQTAIVTGSETDEDIVVDEHGRVQVDFHWNMPGKQHADCSCPVRVASAWAGKSWGAVNYPRVGQEVVVSFIEGDPDRPLIVGSVYNATHEHPYSPQTAKTQSGIKSRSLLGETADFNELRFEDKKGEEDFFIHAQKDMHEEVENDHTVTIDHDEITTVKHDQTGEVKGNRTHTVDKDDKLTVNQAGTTSIGTTFKLSAGDKIELVCGQASITLQSSGQIDIKGSTINLKGMQNVNIEGTMGVKISGMSVEAKADMAAKLEGTMVTVNANAKASVQGAMVSVTGSGMTQISGGILMLG